MKLEWQDMRTDERGYRSTCNRYSVCAITIDGIEHWETWKLAPGGPWFRPLKSGLADETEARAAAQEDIDTCLVRV